MRDLVLGESLAALIDYRGKTPKKLGADFTSSGVPVASAQLVSDGVLHLEEARTVDLETYRKWMSTPVAKGDVVLTSEAPLGRVARVTSDDPLVLGQRLFGLRGMPGVLDSGYLYYVLQTEAVQSDLKGRATGSTVTGIRQSALRQVVIPAPGYREQLAIAEVLGSLDDKIAANATIADRADALVRHRFGQLERRATAAVALGSLATNPRSLVNPSEVERQLTYVGLEHIPRRHMWLTASGSAEDVTSTKGAFERGDVLFGKLRPYFHKVASAPTAGIASTDILVVRPQRQTHQGFLLAALSSDDVVQQCVGASEGTRMPRTGWKDLSRIQVAWPGEEAAKRFSADVEGLRDVVEARLLESRSLIRLRDALLPQLMSGKIRVKDAERAVSEVV